MNKSERVMRTNRICNKTRPGGGQAKIKRFEHIWVSNVLDRPSLQSHKQKHIQPTHKHFRAVPTPASLIGTAFGPEGPRCRRRMGGGEANVEGQRERQVRGVDDSEGERDRETVMTLSFECHHTAKDPH